MRITDEIFQVGGGKLTSYQDAAIYLINFDGDAALIDAGCGDSLNKLLKNISLCGVEPEDIKYILLTHCHFDHTGGVSALKEKIPCKVICHGKDARFLEEGDNEVTAASWYGAAIQPFPVERKLKGDREEIRLGGRIIQAIHVPGHSPGSVVYLAESNGLKVLFAQDVHGPLHPSLLSDKDDYLYSLKLMISLEADILCEGHYGIYEGKDEVKDFIESFM